MPNIVSDYHDIAENFKFINNERDKSEPFDMDNSENIDSMNIIFNMT